MQVDQQRLEQFMGRLVGDMGAAISAALVVIGDQLGLYKAMAGAGPLTPAELAQRTSTTERYVREWLNNQAASGYVTYDGATGRYTLPPEQAMAFADESSPVHATGAFDVIASVFRDAEKLEHAFRNGSGLAWGDHDRQLFEGTARFFAPNYRSNLVQSWIPALEGVEAKLRQGARVADVGCGFGVTTALMAQAFPNSSFVGFDSHEASIRRARSRAREAKVARRAKFEVADSTSYPGTGYDLVAFFDCFHDMADPAGAARHVRETLAPDGTWMIVEPFAGDRVEENLNPVGRVYYGASTTICVPSSLAGGGPALGAQAGERAIGEVVRAAGFSRFRRAAQTPFNLVLEARA